MYINEPKLCSALGTYTIPAGYTISVSLASVHMNPKLYPQPHKFDPDRFAPDKAVGKDRFSFLPFSAGPRICIGRPSLLNQLF